MRNTGSSYLVDPTTTVTLRETKVNKSDETRSERTQLAR